MNAQRKHVEAAPQPAVNNRITEAVRTAAASPAPANEPQERGPELFEAMDRQRYGTDHCGTNWNVVLASRHTGRLAAAHRQATAVKAVAGLLMADEEARVVNSHEDVETPCLSASMREGLFLALTELSAGVHETLSYLGQVIDSPVAQGDARGADQ